MGSEGGMMTESDAVLLVWGAAFFMVVLAKWLELPQSGEDQEQ